MIYIPRIRGASLTHFSIFFLRRAPPLLPLEKEMPHPLVHLPHRLPLFLSPFLYFQSFRPSFLASLSLYLYLETVRKVSRALHVSASGNCPVSQIMLVLHPLPLLSCSPLFFPPSCIAVMRYDTCKLKSLARTLYKRNSLHGYESFIRYHSRKSFFLENGDGGGGVGNCFMDFTRSSSLLRFRSLALSLSLSIYLERVSFHTPRNKLLYLKSLITARIRFLRYTAMRIFPSFRKNGHTLIFFLPVKCCPPIFYHYLIVYFLIFFPPSLSLSVSLFFAT